MPNLLVMPPPDELAAETITRFMDDIPAEDVKDIIIIARRQDGGMIHYHNKLFSTQRIWMLQHLQKGILEHDCS